MSKSHNETNNLRPEKDIEDMIETAMKGRKNVNDKKYVIRLPFGSDDSQGRYYEETNEGAVALFDRKIDAVQYIINNELGDESIADAAIAESIGTCRKCGSPLFPSDVDGYESQCFTCNEDFYSIEQECERE